MHLPIFPGTTFPALSQMDFLLQLSGPWIKSGQDSQGLLVNLLWSLAWTPTQPGVAELDIKQQSPFTLFFSNLPGFTNPELELGSNMWNASHLLVLPDWGQPETWQFVHRGASITVGLSGPLVCINQSRLHVLTTQPSLHKPIRNAWCPWALLIHPVPPYSIWIKKVNDLEPWDSLISVLTPASFSPSKHKTRLSFLGWSGKLLTNALMPANSQRFPRVSGHVFLLCLL